MATQSSHYPNVTKCLLCIDLKLGVLAYLSFELMVWAFLSFMAIDNESSFFHNYDLYKFEEHIEDNWYYQMMSVIHTNYHLHSVENSQVKLF